MSYLHTKLKITTKDFRRRRQSDDIMWEAVSRLTREAIESASL